MMRRERGVAIVLAMGVVAMAAIAAVALMVLQSTWTRQQELRTDHARAIAVTQGGIDWARAILNEDRRTSSVDHLGEPWALRLAPIPIENGEAVGYLTDQQGAFNVNNLVRDGKLSITELHHFQRLLAILELPASLAEALVDWMDSDNQVLGTGGAEDAYYLALNPPYLAANRPLSSIDELSLIRGFDETVRVRLRPYITALPAFTQINVNTAPPEILAAIIDGMNLDTARTVVAARERTYFQSPPDFSARIPRGLVVPLEDIGISSDYFTVTLRVTIGAAQARGFALISRDGTRWPVVLWRKIS